MRIKYTFVEFHLFLFRISEIRSEVAPQMLKCRVGHAGYILLLPNFRVPLLSS